MTTKSGRAEVRDELLGDLGGVTARIVAEVKAEIPAYDGLSAPQLEEVQRIAAWGVSRVLSAWVTDERLDEDDLARFRGIGVARALDGRPLPVVLRAYRVAGSAVTDLVAARARGRLDVDDAIALARLWMASIDALSEALYAGHAQASERLESDHDRALAEFTDDLLAGRHATAPAVSARAAHLGLRLPRRLRLLHVAPAPAPAPGAGSPDASSVGAAAVARGADEPGFSWDDLVGQLSDGTGPLLARGDSAGGDLLLAEGDLDGGAGLPTRLAAARWRGVAIVRPPDGLPRAARLATQALTSAPAYAWHGRPLLDEADALALAQATGHPDADPTALVDRLLDPLSPHPHLRTGLEALVATGGVARAAEAAGTHVQTMHHRVRRIVALTGRDPRTPWDRFVLELALLLDA